MSSQNGSDVDEELLENPSKIRRAHRACLQCRVRKQRCLAVTSPLEAVEILKCRRCLKLDIACSFEIEPRVVPEPEPGPTRLAQHVVDLQKQINKHESRIQQLELWMGRQVAPHGDKSTPVAGDGDMSQMNQGGPNPFHGSDNHVLPSLRPPSEIVSVEFGPPLATLRSLGGWTSRLDSSTNAWALHGDLPLWDPIIQKVLTEDEASHAFRTFFDYCHMHAPLLDNTTRDAPHDLRRTSPVLFLAICTIGCRYWHAPPQLTLHPKYASLTALLDIALSRLLLTPSRSDLNLDSIRALLLYAQWMPLSTVVDQTQPRTRYNDISAWSVLGLAMRYAASLKLEDLAVEPFRWSGGVDDIAMSRLRVWHNLLTCDANLMLSSGLPTSLSPDKACAVADRFVTHTLGQPNDLRVTALVELVRITHGATVKGWSVDTLDLVVLRRLNLELDQWEATWAEKLGWMNGYCNMPFSSARWYRLALNSASLSTLTRHDGVATSAPPSLRQCLDYALTAASQTLLSYSTTGPTNTSAFSTQLPETFSPLDALRPDPTALETLIYTVDSAWISLSFAVTFLVLAYAKGAIEDSMRIVVGEHTHAVSGSSTPISSTSMLGRLLQLSSDIFDRICSLVTVHPAHDYGAVVKAALKTVSFGQDHSNPHLRFPRNGDQMISGGFPDAFDSVFTPDHPLPQGGPQVQDSSATDLQGLLEIMAANGMEWSASLMDNEWSR